ncbi:MAG: DUF3990 domain-containing protein, partial [Chloroflexota bacterium]
MSEARPSNFPPAWDNQAITLYHGTTLTFARLIQQNGVDLSKGNPRSDFGRGFYTTTDAEQAKDWAWKISLEHVDKPSLLEYKVNREQLARLDTLWFLDGKRTNESYWSFVFHCRMGNEGHGRQVSSGSFYDVVIGAVTAQWMQRKIFTDANQVSFHTAKSLNAL